MTTATAPTPTAHTPTVVTVPFRDLLTAVKAAGLGVAPRPPVPLLGCVLLAAGADGFTVTGFDYDTHVQYVVDPTPTAEWQLCVQHRTLLAAVTGLLKGTTLAKFGDTPITVEGDTTGGQVTLTVDGFTVALPAETAGDFPPPPGAAWPQGSTVVDRDVLAAAVKTTLIATAHDPVVPLLSHIGVTVDEDLVRLYGTDRFRLMNRTVPAETTDTFTALVPGKVLTGVLGHCAPGELTIRHSGGMNCFRVSAPPTPSGARLTATLRCLDARPLRFQTLFPADPSTVVVVHRAVLTEAVTRVAALLPKNRPVTLHITDTTVTVAGGTIADEGRVTSPPIPRLSRSGSRSAGGDLDVLLSPSLLLDGLAQFPGDMVALGFTNLDRPVVLAADPSSLTDPDAARYLVMPARNAS